MRGQNFGDLDHLQVSVRWYVAPGPDR